MPTVIILLFTIFIMVTVIPYAFSSVLKQMEAVRALEAAGIGCVIKVFTLLSRNGNKMHTRRTQNYFKM